MVRPKSVAWWVVLGILACVEFAESHERLINYRPNGLIPENDFVSGQRNVGYAPLRNPTLLRSETIHLTASSAPSLGRVSVSGPQLAPLANPVCQVDPSKSLSACYTARSYQNYLNSRAYALVSGGLLAGAEAAAWVQAAGRIAEAAGSERCPSHVATTNTDRLEANFILTSWMQPSCFDATKLQSFSTKSSKAVRFFFTNSASFPVDLNVYSNVSGGLVFHSTVPPGTKNSYAAQIGVAWKVSKTGFSGSCLDTFRITLSDQKFSITDYTTGFL